MAKNMSILFLITLLSAVIAKMTLHEVSTIEEQDETIPEQPASPRRLKRLEISNFKDRKLERSKDLSNRANITNTPSTLVPSTAVYRWKADSGVTCILLVVDALVEFKYITKLDEVSEASSFVSPSATVDGDCKEDGKEILILKWKSFVLKMYFSKTSGGELWYVSKMELEFDSSDQFFAHFKNPGRKYTLSTDTNQGQLLFPTLVGKSNVCDRETEVKLTSPETNTTAVVYLRKLQLQPFIFKSDEFGPEYKCSSTGAGTYRSETAPLIAGSMLASACLLTIVGYAVYRYFNIEKVSYDTME